MYSPHTSSERETALFDGGGQVFECDITLYRFDPNTNKFSDRVLESTELDLGEEVELWSIVKPNDGEYIFESKEFFRLWYAKYIVTILISKLNVHWYIKALLCLLIEPKIRSTLMQFYFEFLLP